MPTTDRRALRAQLGLPTEGRLIVSVARLTPVKGVHVLMKALPAVPDVHAVIVGDGPQRAELEALAPAGQVTFAGQQPHERVLMYLRAADAYVLSSYTEGLSHTLLEAVAVGTPCVATTVGGNPEVITDGRE
nr:glycosyltransferase [Anaerolineae bacterium]